MAQPAKSIPPRPSEPAEEVQPRVPITIRGGITHATTTYLVRVLGSPAVGPDCPTGEEYWRNLLVQLPDVPPQAVRWLADRFASDIRCAIEWQRPLSPRHATVVKEAHHG